MRRFVLLFLLILLPVEVLAGIAYEHSRMLNAQHEASEMEVAHAADRSFSIALKNIGDPAPSDTPPSSDTRPSLDIVEPFSLDLGEAYDVPCQYLGKSRGSRGSSPLTPAIFDKSIVMTVPTPPDI